MRWLGLFLVCWSAPAGADDDPAKLIEYSVQPANTRSLHVGSAAAYAKARRALAKGEPAAALAA